MDACLPIILVIAVFWLIILILIIIERRPKPLCVITNKDMASYKQDTITKLTSQGYLIKEKKKERIFVQKDTFSATTLVFKQNKSNVDVLYIHSNSTAMLIAFIVSFIFIWILAVVLAVIADSKSKDFRENELIPLLIGQNITGRICPTCGRPIPFDANLCPYCGLRF